MIGLTRKQNELLTFIQSYIAANGGQAPSFEEMREAIGLGSKSGVHRLLEALVERGHVRRMRNRVRALELLNADDRFLTTVSTEALHRELSRRMAA